MSSNPKKPKPSHPPGWRDDIVVVPINKVIPPGPGIDWWLCRIIKGE